MSSDSSILTHPLSQFFYYAVLATIPFYYWRQMTPVIPLDWYIAIILGFIMVVFLMTERQLPRFYANNLNRWLLIFMFVNIMSSLFSPYPEAAADGLIVLVQVYLFIFINLAFLTKKGLLDRLPYLLAICVGLNGLIAGGEYFFGISLFEESRLGKSVGVTLGANNASLMSLFVLPLIVHKFLRAKGPGEFFFCLFLIFANISGLVSSESRGGFLIFFIMSVMIIFINRSRFQPRFFGLAISFIGLMMLAVTFAVPDSYYKRQKSLLAVNQDASLRRRTAYIGVGIDSFYEHPLLGTGTFTFPQVWLDSRATLFFKLEDRGAHNTYLDALVGVGFIGLMVFLGLLARVFRDFISAMRNFELVKDFEMHEMANAYFVSFLTLLVYCFIKTLVDHKFFILILAISQVLYLLSEKQKDRLYGQP
ncbi:MAG: O-antigen ligase family protein [Desulfobacterales bacterium]|nr:O-antigen ligase family protein [Desulfobacterales bacterium]